MVLDDTDIAAAQLQTQAMTVIQPRIAVKTGTLGKTAICAHEPCINPQNSGAR